MVAIGGDVRVTLVSGQTVTLPALAPSVLYPVRVKRVWAAGTTAAGIVALR
jgi:hypothetical protein